jgi:predicted MPP superfamily phosphohydrolase
LMLYTNVGIGTLLIPVRWNCPPEVTLITLRSRQPVS